MWTRPYSWLLIAVITEQKAAQNRYVRASVSGDEDTHSRKNGGVAIFSVTCNSWYIFHNSTCSQPGYLVLKSNNHRWTFATHFNSLFDIIWWVSFGLTNRTRPVNSIYTPLRCWLVENEPVTSVLRAPLLTRGQETLFCCFYQLSRIWYRD